MEGVKQFKDLTLTYEGSSGGTFYVSTDLPGGTITVRRTITLPAASSRVTKTFPLDSTDHGGDGDLLEGKLIQHKVTSTAALILYEGSVRCRKVGTYIDGSAGDYWETQPLSLEG